MNIALIISVAILIEALVEYGKSIVDMFEGGDRKTGITQLITIVCGIFMAFAFKVNAFDVLGIAVKITQAICCPNLQNELRFTYENIGNATGVGFTGH